MSDKTPGGLSPTDFKTLALESGQWMWGMTQGAFNQKATLSQIVVDAVIGMIPLVGDVTAVRDIIAVTIRMVDDPKSREDVWEWVLLVVLVIALIPVIGGVVKGVGRLIIKFAKESGKITQAAAKTAHMAKSAREVVSFLNRFGHGNAEKWLLKLKFAEHQAQVLTHFRSTMDNMVGAFTAIETKLGGWLSGALRSRVAGLKNGVIKLKTLGEDMIPKAVKELDAKLREIQAYIRSGGDTTSRATAHSAAAGDKAAIHMTDEARLLEEFGAKRSARGGLLQNVANKNEPKTYAQVYKPEPGYPDLTKIGVDPKGNLTRVQAFAGKIVNRELKEGEQVFRLFGEGGVTHGVPVRETDAGGPFWGLSSAPKTAEEWRIFCGVLDEWNRDGFIVVGKVNKKAKIKSCVGLVSEQAGEKITGQYLPGGGMQAFMDFDREAKSLVNGVPMTLTETGQLVMKDRTSRTWIDPSNGMHYDLHPTGWTDANGIHGYESGGPPGSVSVAPLESTEVASKTQAPAPHTAAKTSATPARGQTKNDPQKK